MSLLPLKHKTLADQTADALRALIASGELLGGQRLIETQIAAQLAVSRGPVRDAFRLLREEGLLADVPRRGTYVVALTASDAREVLDLRAGLEARAARLFIQRRSEEALAEVEAAHAELIAAWQTGRAPDISRADYVFHEVVCRGSGNRRLLNVFIRHATELRILLHSDTERIYTSGVDVAEQHTGLLDALRRGSVEEADAAFRAHVEETRDRLVALLSEPVGA